MKHVRAYCEKWDMLPAGELILCAVSGGRDSMALLHLLSALSEEMGFSLAAAHYNHRLRPTADRDEQLVRDFCRANTIPFHCDKGDVAAFASAAGRGVEDAGRVLRYRFLEETAHRLGAARIATAHHRQDNAETVLLHLLRGSALQGLTGIPPVRGSIVRPLLETDPAVIDRYVSEHSVPFAQDETNFDPRYTRNRLRMEVLPALEALSPGCTGRIARTAELLRRENDYLQQQTNALLPPDKGDGVLTISITLLQQQDEAIACRLVRTMALRLGVELTMRQTQAILSLGSGGVLNLPDGLQAVHRTHQLTLCRGKEATESMVLHPGKQRWGDWEITLWEGESADGRAIRLARRCLTGPLTISVWDGTGRLTVDNGSRTIKRLFLDRGIPVEQRHLYPALCLAGRPIALFGVTVDHAFLPLAGEEMVCITMEKIF